MQEKDLESLDRTITLKEYLSGVKPYLDILLRNKFKLLFFNAAVLLVVLFYLIFLLKPQYRSSIDLLPDSKSPSSLLGNLSGIASLAGINIGSGGNKTILYENIIYSESILTPAILADYKSKNFAKPVDLTQYFQIQSKKDLSPEDDKRYKLLKTIEFLTKYQVVSTSFDKKTEILTLDVITDEPAISASLANNIILALDNYLKTKSKTEASEERTYLEIRNRQIKDSLTIAEDKLRRFREQNRIIEQSPPLLLTQGRLMRDVEILQTVYGEITKQLELAKISEIQDKPVLKVKELAGIPLLKESQNKAGKLIFYMFFSVLISSAYLILRSKKKSE
jgi:uncharacterized protein involved in exopolysaccharide biosynthesis